MIENISLPEEVEKSMDKRTSMGVLGDMGKYTQYQAAEAMREAANNPGGGLAGMGVGMGAAATMGQMFTQAMQQPAAQPSQAAPAAVGFCANCGQPLSAGAKFCANCGTKVAAAGSACPACGEALEPGAKFCMHCGQKL